MSMSTVRFGAVHRLTEGGKPITDPAKLKGVLPKYMAKHPGAPAVIPEVPVASPMASPKGFLVITDPEKSDFIKKAMAQAAKMMQGVFSGKPVDQKAMETEGQKVLDDLVAKATDLDVATL